jgi:hypothetical protein
MNPPKITTVLLYGTFYHSYVWITSWNVRHIFDIIGKSNDGKDL